MNSTCWLALFGAYRYETTCPRRRGVKERDAGRIRSPARGASIEVSLPKDVPWGMRELIDSWYRSERTIADIAAFHARFEHIHPFQEGSGRTGRFLALKQCIESGLDLISIDAEYERPYKAWLEFAQSEGKLDHLVAVFQDCQERFDQKMREKGVDMLLDF